jgi:hypothetical protein
VINTAPNVGTVTLGFEAAGTTNFLPNLPDFHRRSRGGDMKKNALALIGVLSLLLAAGSALAQTHGKTIRADIPFKFVVNKAVMPAGEYEVSRYGSIGQMVLVHNAKTGESVIASANAAQSLHAADKTKLVFKRYGDRYFLSQVWVEGNSAGQQLPKSPHEAEVALDFSSQPVVILASLR